MVRYLIMEWKWLLLSLWWTTSLAAPYPEKSDSMPSQNNNFAKLVQEIFAILCPQENCLQLSQSMDFHDSHSQENDSQQDDYKTSSSENDNNYSDSKEHICNPTKCCNFIDYDKMKSLFDRKINVKSNEKNDMLIMLDDKAVATYSKEINSDNKFNQILNRPLTNYESDYEEDIEQQQQEMSEREDSDDYESTKNEDEDLPKTLVANSTETADENRSKLETVKSVEETKRNKLMKVSSILEMQEITQIPPLSKNKESEVIKNKEQGQESNKFSASSTELILKEQLETRTNSTETENDLNAQSDLGQQETFSNSEVITKNIPTTEGNSIEIEETTITSTETPIVLATQTNIIKTQSISTKLLRQLTSEKNSLNESVESVKNLTKIEKLSTELNNADESANSEEISTDDKSANRRLQTEEQTKASSEEPLSPSESAPPISRIPFSLQISNLESTTISILENFTTKQARENQPKTSSSFDEDSTTTEPSFTDRDTDLRVYEQQANKLVEILSNEEILKDIINDRDVQIGLIELLKKIEKVRRPK